MTDTAPQRTAPAAGLRRVDRRDYACGRELARGGMGRILLAHDVRHDRPVAVKELLHHSPDRVARFEREALIAARLQHPAIVPIYEVGVWDDTGEAFIAMKLVEGRTLDAAIDKLVAVGDRLALMPHVIAVADALAYAHAHGVIHRDLKPHNVLVGNHGETVVIDWGLAKVIGDAELATASTSAVIASHLTADGAALGTPAYMPPEQARGEAVDTRADVYALGAMMYHLIAGRRPAVGAATAEGSDLLARIARIPPRPLGELGLAVPVELLTIVGKAMAHDAADRYRDAGELAIELRRFAAGERVDAHRYSRRALVSRWIRRHRVALGAAAGIAVASVVGIVLVQRAGSAQRAAERYRRQADDSSTQTRARIARGIEATRLHPGDASAWFGLAIAQNEVGDNVAAEASAGRATVIAPDNAAYWYVYGEMGRINHKPEQALAAYREALAREPTHRKAADKVAVVLYDAGRVREAEAFLVEQIGRDPNDPYLHFNLGWVYSTLRQHARAIAEFEKYLALAPADDGSERGKALAEIAALKQAAH